MRKLGFFKLSNFLFLIRYFTFLLFVFNSPFDVVKCRARWQVKRKKRQACKPGSVSRLIGTFIIYLVPISLLESCSLPLLISLCEEKQGGQPCCTATAATNQDIHGFATREAYGSRCCHRDRCAFTAPFHPFPNPTRRIEVVIFCYTAIPFQRSSR